MYFDIVYFCSDTGLCLSTDKAQQHLMRIVRTHNPGQEVAASQITSLALSLASAGNPFVVNLYISHKEHTDHADYGKGTLLIHYEV